MLPPFPQHWGAVRRDGIGRCHVWPCPSYCTSSCQMVSPGCPYLILVVVTGPSSITVTFQISDIRCPHHHHPAFVLNHFLSLIYLSFLGNIFILSYFMPQFPNPNIIFQCLGSQIFKISGHRLCKSSISRTWVLLPHLAACSLGAYLLDFLSLFCLSFLLFLSPFLESI